LTCALYARVSTKDKGQDVQNQLRDLRRYAKAQSWKLVEFVDHETGKHANRAQFKALFEGASRREFGVVLVWALDRFSREGVAETFAHIKRLLDYGVQFESFTEPQFRTTGPAVVGYFDFI
jgi:DNA invertase Pin-like site-specific DNA recombinase